MINGKKGIVTQLATLNQNRPWKSSSYPLNLDIIYSKWAGNLGTLQITQKLVE